MVILDWRQHTAHAHSTHNKTRCLYIVIQFDYLIHLTALHCFYVRTAHCAHTLLSRPIAYSTRRESHNQILTNFISLVFVRSLARIQTHTNIQNRKFTLTVNRLDSYWSLPFVHKRANNTVFMYLCGVHNKRTKAHTHILLRIKSK